MAMLPIKPLDGADGYLRWKESVILRLHSVGVAHVLSKSNEPPPDPAPAEAAGAEAAKKWARDDAVCRGHILYALSNRIFPDYVRHGTGRAVWQAVARTYDLDKPSGQYSRKYERNCFRFEGGAPSSFLEQLAHLRPAGVATPSVSWQRFLDFPFDDDDEEGASSLLEQIAHAEALAAAADHTLVSLSESAVVRMVCQKLPEDVGFRAMVGSVPGRQTMDS